MVAVRSHGLGPPSCGPASRRACYVKDFFAKMGFTDTSRDELPQKVWMECRNKCVKYPDKCNETALTLSLD